MGWGLLRGRGSSVPPDEPDPVVVTSRYDTIRTLEQKNAPHYHALACNSYGCCSHGGGWDCVGQTNTEPTRVRHYSLLMFFSNSRSSKHDFLPDPATAGHISSHGDC